MYVPLCVPSVRLPPYVQLDRSSWWHLSALLSMAVETMTLPTRRRRIGADTTGLDDLESSLNVMGNQRIAGLQCGVRAHSRSSVEPRDGLPDSGANDGRLSTPSSGGWEHEGGRNRSSETNQDMDFFSASGQRWPERIFSGASSMRGCSGTSVFEEIAGKDYLFIDVRKRQKLEGRRTEKSVTHPSMHPGTHTLRHPCTLHDFCWLSSCFLEDALILSSYHPLYYFFSLLCIIYHSSFTIHHSRPQASGWQCEPISP